jgi:hypothetical protein
MCMHNRIHELHNTELKLSRFLYFLSMSNVIPELAITRGSIKENRA